jgi:hypothetical protein
MGCGTSRMILEGNDKPLDPTMEQTHLEEVDKALKNASKVIEIVEALRSTVVDDFEELLLTTGACVYKTPNLEKCIHSFLYLAEKEKKGYIHRVEPSYESPYFRSDVVLPDKISKVYTDLKAFMSKVTSVLREWDEVKVTEVKQVGEKVVQEAEGFEKMLTDRELVFYERQCSLKDPVEQSRSSNLDITEPTEIEQVWM